MSRDFLRPHLEDLPYFRALLRAVEARLMRQVELPPPTLDIGSGDGHFASVAFERQIDVGVDPAWAHTREAQARGAYRSLVLADGAQLPHPNAAFASAFSNSVLEHVDRLEEVLSEIGRVLRPGAPFAITVPNPGYRSELSIPRILRRVGLARLAEAYRDWFMRVTRTVNLFDETGWTQRLQRAGFEVEHSLRYFSPEALRVLEWGHYFGVPSLISRWMTGRWITGPFRWTLGLKHRLLRPHYEQAAPEDGTYSYFLARKV
jgi:SAM-dependent methyltransferase